MKGSTSAKGRLPIETAKDKTRWTRLVNLVNKMHKQGLKTSLDIVAIYNKGSQRGKPVLSRGRAVPGTPGTALREGEPLRKRGKKLSLQEIIDYHKKKKKK